MTRKNQPASANRRLWLLAALIPLLLGVGYFALQFPGRATGAGERKVDFEVSQGVGAMTVSRKLAELGLIRDADYFRQYLRFTGRSGKLKVGTYALDDSMSASEIAAILTEGRIRLIALTIPEGWHNRQIGDYLTEKGFVESREAWLAVTRDPAARRKYGILDETTEGYLFPETYMVPPGYKPEQIQELMLKRFAAVIREVQGDAEYSPQELRQRIVLASIIEREAVKPEERPIMSRVFLNRLDKGMRLESCATVQYLFERPKRRLYDRDIAMPSPYNTYLHRGLPPGPISNPGRAAIEAAFSPAESEYLFFVLKPDGSHHFSTTYAEHLTAKRKYLGG